MRKFLKLSWILILIPLAAAADGGKTCRTACEHDHPGLQQQIDQNSDLIQGNSLWIDELDRRLSTQITSNNMRINQIEDSFRALVEQGNTNALNIHNLALQHDVDVADAYAAFNRLDKRLTASVAASSALDFTAPAVNDSARLNFGGAIYDSEPAFGIGYVRKLKNKNTFAIGIAADFGFDEPIIKGSFGLALD